MAIVDLTFTRGQWRAIHENADRQSRSLGASEHWRNTSLYAEYAALYRRTLDVVEGDEAEEVTITMDFREADLLSQSGGWGLTGGERQRVREMTDEVIQAAAPDGARGGV